MEKKHMRKVLLLLLVGLGLGLASPQASAAPAINGVALKDAARTVATIEDVHYRHWHRRRHWGPPVVILPFPFYRPRPYYYARPYHHYGYYGHPYAYRRW